MRADVAFLRSVEDHSDIGNFDNAVYLLRTAKQHKDNRKATTFYSSWTSTHQPWDRAATDLAADFAKAIVQLERVSSRVRREQALSTAWRDNASIEPEMIFEAVCRDINVRFNYGHKRRLVRNVTLGLQRLKPGDDIRAIAEELCVQEITSGNRSLPVPYFEILDRLDLIGKAAARAALLLAYSIEAATNLTDEEFLLRLEEAWKLVDS